MYLMKCPMLICLDETNHSLRDVAATVLDEHDPRSMRNLTRSRRATESRLLRFYGVEETKTPFPRLPKPPEGQPLTQAYFNNQAVRSLVSAGFLKSVRLAE